MTRKKWRITRVMAVPATWQGTPERFYHFLLGYLVPLIVWQERTGTMEVAVRDTGPHNSWFGLLRPGTDVEFMPPGVMLERVLSHRQERVILHDWDNPTRFHRRTLEHVRQAVLPRIPRLDGSAGELPRITVLERRPSIDYYREESAELHGGGADWRSIPNITDMVDSLSALGSVSLVDTAGMTPQQQVAALAGTDLLVGQHGGGLSNMMWMTPGSGVIEILPPRPPIIDAIFSNLASACRVGYRALPQAEEHAPVDPAAVTAAAAEVLADPSSCVPTATGSLPMRLLRQLPRRL